MAASTVITFDDQAPVVDLDDGAPLGANAVQIPYTVDEPATLEVTASAPGRGSFPVTVEPTRIVVSGLPSGVDFILFLDAEATDDVNNSAVYSAGYPVVTPEMMERAWVLPTGGVELEPGVTGGIVATPRKISGGSLLIDNRYTSGTLADDYLTGGLELSPDTSGIEQGRQRTGGTSQDIKTGGTPRERRTGGQEH